MATARDLITDAFYACGALGVGESLDADDAQMALRRLNRMLSSWSTEVLSIYEEFDDTLTLNGSASYASTSLASATRPTRVTGCRVTIDSIDYPVEIVTKAVYDGIADKSTTGTPPSYLYIQPGMANATLYFWPVPASGTAKLACVRPLPSTLVLGTSISLPPGYEKAIVDNLAVDIHKSLMGVDPSGHMVQMANESKAAIQRMNWQPSEADLRDWALNGRGAYDINVD